MKIFHLSSSDISGGAARSAYRIHKALHSKGLHSKLLVNNKVSKDQKKNVFSSLNEGDSLDLLVVEVKPDDKNIILMLDESNVDD